MTKGRLLTLWVAFTILAYIFAGQDWFVLSMAPNGDSVRLAAYDGVTSFGNIAPMLMLNFAGILAVAFVGSWGRKITLGLILLANLGTAFWTVTRVLGKDVSGLAKQVEQMTGIAAAHGVKDLIVQTQAAPTWFLVTYGLVTLMTLITLILEHKWPKRAQRTERASNASKNREPRDSIGIWDSQRN